jgi:hypothetical protein
MVLSEVRRNINGPSFEEAKLIIERDLGNDRMKVCEFLQYKTLADRLGLVRDGVHDIFHAGKVLANVGDIGRWLKKDGIVVRLPELEQAAVKHDRKRKSDGFDLLHGWRAAVAERLEFAGELLHHDLGLIQTLCIWHVFDDWMTPKWIKELPEMKALEDGDALDRHRNGGDLDMRFLRLSQSYILVPITKALHDRVEARRGEAIHPFDIISQEALAIGMLIP